MLNHVLYYIALSALVLGGLIVAFSACVAIVASVRKGKAERLAQSVTSEFPASDTNSFDDVDAKEVEEQ